MCLLPLSSSLRCDIALPLFNDAVHGHRWFNQIYTMFWLNRCNAGTDLAGTNEPFICSCNAWQAEWAPRHSSHNWRLWLNPEGGRFNVVLPFRCTCDDDQTMALYHLRVLTEWRNSRYMQMASNLSYVDSLNVAIIHSNGTIVVVRK